jgi:hypothetical protein
MQRSRKRGKNCRQVSALGPRPAAIPLLKSLSWNERAFTAAFREPTARADIGPRFAAARDHDRRAPL